MKLSDIKQQVDEHVEMLDINKIIQFFENCGYKFEPIESDYVDFVNDNFWDLLL